MYKNHVVVSDEVAQAFKGNKPVVALESTIISHGMPYPQNVETALRVEEIVRKNGATPATIAIIKGKLKVGLSESEIDYLGQQDPRVLKASRRDIPVIVAKNYDGATTVAATMLIAALAGIKVFATGGIGGVHRGADKTFDISADLHELCTTNVAVVCAGAKSILDLGLTLEYLETYGVPVIGYQTDEFPAFYTRTSGFKVGYRLDSPQEIADAIKIQGCLNLKGGMLIANPIPEEYQMDSVLIEGAIQTALQEAQDNNIKGKYITPFLLTRVKDITGGASLESNIQLVLNNAALGARIAECLSKGA